MARRIRKVDANQGEIVEALRAAGCSVEILSDVGRGVPDLLVGKNGLNFLMEVKNGDASLTNDERNWMFNWEGQKATVRTPEEALKVLNKNRYMVVMEKYLPDLQEKVNQLLDSGWSLCGGVSAVTDETMEYVLLVQALWRE